MSCPRQSSALVPRFPNKMSVADLITCLDAIVACDEIESERILNWGRIEDRHPLLQEADKLANKLLLTPDGERNRFNEQELMMNSPFRVFPIEQDSFGWLAAGITTDKGYVAYG